jgi:predicted dehydrogenase
MIGVADLNQERAREAATSWGIPRWFKASEELFKIADLDFVDICVPHDVHSSLIEAACRYGKHLLVEKPLARTVAEFDEIRAVVKASGVRLMVGHNLLFNPAVEKVKAVVDAGVLGRVVLMRGFSLGWYLFQGGDFRLSRDHCGGGVFIDTGTHFVYLAQYLLGEITRVSSLTAKTCRNEMGCEDTALVLLRFSGGAVGEMVTSYSVRLPWWQHGAPLGWDQGLDIYGTRGAVRLSITTGRMDLWLQDHEFLQEGWLKSQGPYEYSSSFQREIAHFVDCLRRQDSFKVTLDDARNTASVVEAVYRSAETGVEVEV